MDLRERELRDEHTERTKEHQPRNRAEGQRGTWLRWILFRVDVGLRVKADNTLRAAVRMALQGLSLLRETD